MRQFRVRGSGFTLIELVIVMAVVFVLVVLAVPSFQTYLEKARVREAADNISNLLAKARAESIKLNLPVSVKAVSSSAGAVWCVGALQATAPAAWAQRPISATACDCDSAIATCLVADEQLAVTSTTTTTRKPTIAITGFDYSYSPRLGGISANGSNASFLSTSGSQLDITSSSGRFKVSVVVSPLGQARVCQPAGVAPILGYRPC
ncbi:MAG: GspH/FimT family pseudopilin [Steroidobacteraceae bacterium]